MTSQVSRVRRRMTVAVWLIGLILSAQVNLAAKTDIEIRGMQSMSQSEVLEIISGRLVFVRKKPASPWRANDAAYLVEQILRREGFPEARVRGVVEASDRIGLTVDEGPKRSLGKVEILGDGDAESLTKIFATPFTKKSVLEGGDIPYRDSDLDEGLEFVRRELQSVGYWKADVSLKSKAFDDDSGDVNIDLKVNKGPRFRIGTPTVESPDGRGVKRAATTWAPFIGEWAETKTINKLKTAMVEAFISRGYPDAAIYMSRRLGADEYFPEFRIELGTRVRLLEVEPKGLERTNPDRVSRITQPLEGEWYDEAAMNRSVSKLLATGAFSSIRIDTHEVARKRINATLHFTETKAKEISFSAGAGSFSGPILRSTYLDRNFRGNLKAFSAGFELSGLGLLGEVKLVDPWWGEKTSNELRWFALNKSYDGYQIFESGLESRWQWSLTDHFSLGFLLGYSFALADEDGLPSAFLGDDTYSHARVGITPAWDYRDNKVLPKSGWHLRLPMRVGTTVGEDKNAYLKLGMESGWYYPLSPTYQLGIGASAQWVIPTGDIADLPIDLRVFNGGSRSVRSFPERELGPGFGGDPFGGDFSWAVQTELSRPITGPLRAVAFIDAGGVSGDFIPPTSGGLELAAGLGLRLDLPIGPVRLEYGHNLTQDADEPSGTWHFAIGATF